MTAYGAFAWYQLMTNDPRAADAFYRAAIGWTTDKAMPGSDYVLFKAEGAGVAGMLEMPEDARSQGARPSWMGYISVEDVDATAAKAQALGGKVWREPADIPGVLRFAVLGDPHDAPFVVFTPQPVDERPAISPGQQGAFGWRELLADDVEEAFAFYAALFGWTKAQAFDMGAMGAYQLFTVGGRLEGGMMRRPASTPGAFWTYYINVDSVKVAAERVTSAGGTVVNGPHEVPTGQWIVQALDPEGVLFALLSDNP